MQNAPLVPFHLAFPVDDLEAAEAFYTTVIGCRTGRRSDQWIDFDFFGHQVVAHLSNSAQNESTNLVDGENVPVRHFGLVLDRPHWQALKERIEKSETNWLVRPQIRFEGQTGEQGTFFVADPCGNALEFKYFDDPEQIFRT